MITRVSLDRSEVLSIGLPFVNSIVDLQCVRSGLMEIVDLVTADEDLKDDLSAASLWLLQQMVDTLNTDIRQLIMEENGKPALQ